MNDSFIPGPQRILEWSCALRDLFGLDPVGLPDQRPWLDHGRWDQRHPLANEPKR
jgi:Ni,Fe-hydrogenase III component G